MKIASEIKLAIAKALECRMPFAAHCKPNNSDVVFYADDRENSSSNDCDFFSISQWDKSLPPIKIRKKLDATTLLAKEFTSPKQTVAPWENECEKVAANSTDKAEYISKVGALIEQLKQNGGKVVISRIEVENDTRFNIAYFVDLAERLFSSATNSFRSIYYTPETGAWLGASPELILDCDSNGDFSTMALAGTLPNDETAWDKKNCIEHQYVIDYIANTLNNLGISPTVESTATIKHGNLRHLLTPIKGKQNGVEPMDIIESLHPTPAIAGYPKDMALQLIAATESHNRECYGGYLAVSDKEGVHAYLNIRCLKFAPGAICRYAGGGIIAESDPESEWDETTLKLSSTRWA